MQMYQENVDYTYNVTLFSIEANGVSEIEYQVKALADKPKDPRSIPRTHTMEGENQHLQLVHWPLQIHNAAYTHTHKFNKKFKNTSKYIIILIHINSII